ncbi:MAG: beta-lactamase family protein [Alphaproteobacteria bacterium]|nr:beta-lactamase family protein [Alphaproteobacteria bacterium]
MSRPPSLPVAEIESVCKAFAQEHRLPGLGAGIVQGGRMVHATTIGLADREARRGVSTETGFRIASMTKNMTSLAVLVLRDRGLLQLDRPLFEYVPQFATVRLPTADSPPVTVRHLITHTAGFVTDDPWADRVLGMTPAEFNRLIAEGTLFAQPTGIAFEYSNLGYALLGRVLTNVSGEPYQAFIRRTFIEPLGLVHTTFDAIEAQGREYAYGYRLDGDAWSRERIEPDGEVGAMGGLVTTVPDYARWIAFLLDAWPPRDAPDTGPARRATIREMGLWCAPIFLPESFDGRPASPTAYGYGLMSSLDPKLGRRLHHSGGLPGYGSHVLMLPDSGRGVFAFANRTYAPMARLTLRLADMIHDALPKPEPTMPSHALSRAVGLIVAAYGAGRIQVAAEAAAVNFFLDTPQRLRDAELAALKKRLGEGHLESIEPTHDLAGRFTITCAKGKLRGTIILSPDFRPGLQKLTLTAEEF